MDKILLMMMEKIGAHKCAIVASETENGDEGITTQAELVQLSSSGNSLQDYGIGSNF